MIAILHNIFPRQFLLLLCTYLSLCPQLLNAQVRMNEGDFERYATSNGLSQNIIFGITQDRLGYIWLATDNGINRFDGMQFRNFYKGNKELNLVSDIVFKIGYIGNDEIAVLTFKGLQVINTRTFAMRIYQVKDATSFSRYLNHARDFKALPKGQFLLSTKTGLYHFNRKGELVFRYDHVKKQEDLKDPAGFGNEIFSVGPNRYMMYTSEGMSCYDAAAKRITVSIDVRSPEWKPFFHNGGKWTLVKQVGQHDFLFISRNTDSIYYYNHREKKRVSSPVPFAVNKEIYASYSKFFKLDNANYAISCAYGGLFTFWLDKKTGKINFSNDRYFAREVCNDIYKDRDGRLWIATFNGLFKKRTVSGLVSAYNYAQKRDSKNIFMANAFRYGKYIFATCNDNGHRVYVIDPRTKKPVHDVRFFDKEEWNQVYAVQSYHPDTIWFSSLGGITWLHARNFTYGEVKTPDAFKGKLVSLGELNKKDGCAWICAIGQPYYCRYNIKTREFTTVEPSAEMGRQFKEPVSMVYDAYGDVWFYGNGIMRWSQNKNRFDTIIPYFGGINKYESKVLFMKADQDGSLWIHPLESGLVQYRIKDKKFDYYGAGNGLPVNHFHSVSPIVDHALWVGFQNQLFRFGTRDKKVVTYNQNDGIPELFYTGEITYDPVSSTFMAPMNNYLAFFSDNNRGKQKSWPIILTEVNIKNKKFWRHPGDTLNVQYNQKNLVLYLAILNYNVKIPYTLSYSLDGEESYRFKQDQPIFLSNLSAGKHVLEIKSAYGAEHIQPKRVYIFVKSPFWKAYWFFGMIFGLVVLVVFLVIRSRARKMRNEARINQQMREFEMKALHAQMNPHFIFNCLNSIKALVIYNRNEEASVYINKFSKLVRKNLDHSRRQFVNLKDNIDYLNQYLEMENLRFTNFKYQISVDENIDQGEVKIAPMLLQPLVENAIWHGLQPSSSERSLQIRFTSTGEFVKCEIEDNGIGINKSLKQRQGTNAPVGIDNIRQRIGVFNEKYKLDYSIRLVDRSDIDPSLTGTLVTLIFNYYLNHD